MRRILVLAAALSLVSAGVASAAPLIFGVDFGTDANYTGTGVLGETFSRAVGTEHINDINGNPTGATVNLFGPLGGSPGPFSVPGGGANLLFQDFVAIGNEGPAPGQTTLDYQIQAVLSGLTPDTPYEVAVYCGSDANVNSAVGSSQIVDFGSGGAGDVIQTVTEDSTVPNYRSGFIPGENYALSVETTDASGDLTFSVQGENSADPILNGFGISSVVAVPEPSALMLMLGAVGSLLLGTRVHKTA